MKKLSFIFALLAFRTFLCAQASQSLDFVIGIDRSHVETDLIVNGVAVSDHITNNNNLRFGLDYNHPISSDIVLKTGLRYTTIGTSFTIDDVRWPSEIGPDGWVPDPNLPRSTSTATDHRFFEIPILARLELGDGPWQPFIELGVASLMYHNTKTTRRGLEKSTSVERVIGADAKPLMFSVITGAGVQYQMSSHFQVFTSLSLRYALNEVSAFSGDRLSTIGLEAGVRYRLDSQTVE